MGTSTSTDVHVRSVRDERSSRRDGLRNWLQTRGRARLTLKRHRNARIFPDATQNAILDDSGHRITDTLDKLSPVSVDAVGETLVELARRFSDG
jgi:hypothetical protein